MSYSVFSHKFHPVILQRELVAIEMCNLNFQVSLFDPVADDLLDDDLAARAVALTVAYAKVMTLISG